MHPQRMRFHANPHSKIPRVKFALSIPDFPPTGCRGMACTTRDRI